MGLSSSKHNAAAQSAPSSSSGAAAVLRSRSGRSRVLKSSCLRSRRRDCDEPQVCLLTLFLLFSGDFDGRVDRIYVLLVECGLHMI